MIRVLLVDDHPVVRAGYGRLLEQAGGIAVVGESASAEEAYGLAFERRADVTVTDLSMPGGGGLELVRRLLARAPAARVLIFSMHETETLVRRALDAGALGFVAKSAAPECLVEAVRTVHHGRRYVSPGLAPSLRLGRVPREAETLAQLTEREFALFRLLAQGHPIAECARILNLSSKTVSNYQSQIKEKLGVATTAAMAHLALRQGVIGAAPPAPLDLPEAAPLPPPRATAD
jgi:DNA-binding NarL/FixJ family response regulator